MTKQTRLEEVKKMAVQEGAVPVVRELLADTLTPIGLISLVRRHNDRYFLLESMEGIDARGRYSFVGYAPIARVTAKDFKVTVAMDGKKEAGGDNPLDVIRRFLKEYHTKPQPGLPPFTGGFVGYFSYDFIQYCEPSLRFDPKKATEFPDFDLMLFDKVIAFDQFKQKLYLIVNIRTDDIEKEYARAGRALDEMEALVREPVALPADVPAKMGPISSNQTRELYDRNVLRIKEYIRQGDIFQAVYSQRFSASYDQDLFNLYRRLRTTNPSQYMVLFKNEDTEIAGASPETLIKLEGRTITSMPIAGTRPRGTGGRAADGSEGTGRAQHARRPRPE